MPENYLSAGDHIRNIGDFSDPVEVLEEIGKFRIVRLPPPFCEGCELWIVNEKGFLWEPAASLDVAFAYLDSAEAKAYQAASDI